MDNAERRAAGAVGGHKSWGNTPDRAARMRPAWSRSPSGWDWHAQKRFGKEYDELTADEQQQVASDRKAWFADMRRRSNEALAAKAAATRKARLRRRAALLRAEADELEAEA